MKLAHFIALGLVSSLSLSAYAQKGGIDEAIGAYIASANAPSASDDDDWGEQSIEPTKKSAPAPMQAPVPAAEAPQSVASPTSDPKTTDDINEGESPAPEEKAPAAKKLPQRKVLTTPVKPMTAPEVETPDNEATKPAAVDPVPDTTPAPASAPVQVQTKAPVPAPVQAQTKTPLPVQTKNPTAVPVQTKKPAPTPAAATAPAAAQIQTQRQPAAKNPVAAPEQTQVAPAPKAVPSVPAPIPSAAPIKQVPAGVPLNANAAAVPQVAPGNPLLPAKDSSAADLTDDLRRADPNTSTSATRAKARVRPSDVGLSAEQTNAILEIRKSAQTATEKRLTEELKSAKIELNSAMIDATPAEEVRRKFDLVQKRYLELQKIKFERTLKIREVLSVEQRRKLQGVKNSH